MTPTPMVVPLTTPGTPVTFQLNGTGELELKCVQATIDGSAAASAFYPVLSIYTQDDKLISRTRTTDTVAAAGSAIVTWAPFLSQQAAAKGGGASLATMFRVYPTSNITCPTGVTTQITFAGTGINLGSAFTTADSKTFTLALGVWLISLSYMVDYTAVGTTTAVTSVNLQDGAGVVYTDQFTLAGITHTGGNVSRAFTYLMDGRASPIALNVDLFNFEGFDLLFRGPADLSALAGVLVQTP